MERLSLLFLLLSSVVASVVAEVISNDGPLIRQVVSDGVAEEDFVNQLLNAEHHFTLFKSKFGKTYATKEEHDYRLGVFKANLRRAKRHQLLDPTAVHGITKFSDLTPSEFRRQFLGLKPLKLPADAQKAPILPTDDLPDDFDWRDQGAVTGVKDQLVSLSEQQLVDCDHECDPQEYGACDSGCNGGLMTTAFEYILKAGGLETEKDYPYTRNDRGPCKFDKTKIAASVSNFSVISIDEDQIAANLTYIHGVSCPYICGKHLDHGVLLVGYGSAGYAPVRFKNKPYWIIKNSWGENGYYKICRGNNVCGVDSMVSSVSALHILKRQQLSH
ncbi:hypothetical protein V6Z11_A05G199800 [Gossypium hirsutum]